MIEEYIKLTSTDGNIYQFTGFRDVNIEFELDDIIQTMNFKTSTVIAIAAIMKRNDFVEYFIKPDDSKDFICKFRGYIDAKLKTKSKTSSTISWQCTDKLSRFNRINMEYAISITDLNGLVNAIKTQVDKILPGFLDFDIRLDGSDIILRNVEKSKNILEALRSIREKTILYVYYDPVIDKVVITTPLYLQYEYRNAGLQTYEFDSNENMLGTLNYGDVNNDINAVIYVGIGGVKGMAIDFANYAADDQIRPLYKYDFSTGSKEELEKKARNELLDIMRNFNMSFNIPLNKESLSIPIGSLCTINDHDEYDGTRYFIISKQQITVTKSDIIISLTVRAGSLQDFPEDLVLRNFGITDIDTLEVNNEKPSGVLL